MIGFILLASAPLYVIPPLTDAAPQYEASCEFVLTDHTRQTVTFAATGSGYSRPISLQIDGQSFQATDNLGGIGKDAAGNDRVDEGVMVPSGNDPEYMYRTQYSMPGPSAVQAMTVLKFNNKHGEFFGLGLCWTKVEAQ